MVTGGDNTRSLLFMVVQDMRWKFKCNSSRHFDMHASDSTCAHGMIALESTMRPVPLGRLWGNPLLKVPKVEITRTLFKEITSRSSGFTLSKIKNVIVS
jgi:hypothetical protein